jgi:hypothetical protein
VVELGLRIGREMPIDDACHLHPLQKRPQHGQRAEITALGLRLISIPSDRDPHNMAHRGRGPNTTFGETSGCGK